MLYILGDLFEVWLGDSVSLKDYGDEVAALKALHDHGTALFFLPGNRDFLIGEEFAIATGATLLKDDYVDIAPFKKRILICHGDTLCTDDTAYQEFRDNVRSDKWREEFFNLSETQRRELAKHYRNESKNHSAQKDEVIMDVNQNTVEKVLDAHNTRFMVHGHTHRPNVHHFTMDGQPATRIVLGDWYKRGSVLRLSEDCFELCTLETW